MWFTLICTFTPLTIILYVVYYPPRILFNLLQTRNPNVLFHIPLPSTHRVVALTLDDVPSPSTSLMLDSLKEYNAKATFFIIGDQVPGYENVIQRIQDEGHEYGNHCWSDEKTILRSLDEVERQVKAVEKLIPENANGVKYFRPGGGFFSNEMVERVLKLGYRVVLGCVYPHDVVIPSPWLNARHVMSMVRPGAIIVMHDRREHSEAQLELILEELKGGGWDVVSLGGLLAVAEGVDARKKG